MSQATNSLTDGPDEPNSAEELYEQHGPVLEDWATEDSRAGQIAKAVLQVAGQAGDDDA